MLNYPPIKNVKIQISPLRGDKASEFVAIIVSILI